jgi:hypothetical protein
VRYAAGALLFLATACTQDLPSPPPARSAAHAQPAREKAQFALVNPGDPGGSSAARRNVFAYPAPARAVVVPKEAVISQPPVTTTIAHTDTSVPEKKDFTFPYRYIGRFGPENGQLAAFVADGQATVVKTGEVLGGKFLVRAIGIESVEVSLLSAPELRKTLDIGQ